MRRNRSKTASVPFSQPPLGSPRGGLSPASQRARLDDDMSPLVHPARDPGRSGNPPRTVRPLIRTVLTDTNKPRRTNSPTVLSRASSRASIWSRSLPEPYSRPPQLPQRAIKCAKDAIRREVLFAIKGAGGSGRKYPGRKSPTKTNCR